MQDSKPNLSDIAIPETVEVAIMKWWNSTVCRSIREDADADSYMFSVMSAVKVALLSLARNPDMLTEKITSVRDEWRATGFRNHTGFERYLADGLIQELFLGKPAPVPEEVKALMFPSTAPAAWRPTSEESNNRIMAAFKAGKEARNADKHWTRSRHRLLRPAPTWTDSPQDDPTSAGHVLPVPQRTHYRRP